MKKNAVIAIGGLFSGGIVGVMYYWLFVLKGGDGGYALSSTPGTTTIFTLFSLLGSSLAFAVYYKQRFDVNERTIGKHKNDNKAKDDLISMTLHHIRTPLTGMMWSTKELSVETPADHPQKNRIEKLHEETVRILATVEKLLKTSRENNGRSSYCFETYSMEKLERLISESISKMKPAAYAKNISVETETSPLSLKAAKIDGDKIITVVQTLFENAVHYTKTEGGIKIRMEEKGDNFFFYMSDTGIGIPLEEQNHIFSQFYRSSNAKRLRSDGLGIGLFLAKSFVDAHGGSITFTSNSKGTTFMVRIPTFEPAELAVTPAALPSVKPPTQG